MPPRMHTPAPAQLPEIAMDIRASSSPSSTPGSTLSAVIAEDRRREARYRHRHAQGGILPLLVPACGRPVGQAGAKPPHVLLINKLHRWVLSKSPGAAVTRKLEPTSREPPIVPPPPPPPPHDAPAAVSASASVPERRPLREREEPAAVRAPPPAAEADTSAGESAGSCETTATPPVVVTPVVPGGGGRGGTWLKASSHLSLQRTDTSEEESPRSLADESPTSAAAVVADDDDKFVLADKYRPNVLSDFICNKAVADELYQLVLAHQCSHFIFEGPPSAGKRSMVLALIRDGFGPHDLKIEEQTKRFELKGEIRKHIAIRVKISEHHVEVNVADLHGYEKYVITTLLNESIPSPNSVCDHTNCRVIVIHDADKLSSDLQHYIGWFLGRYAGCNKIIFCCSDASNLEAIKHLCKVVTLQPPSFDEIIKVLEYIATKEGIDLPRDLARRITVSASNNLRQAIRSFEATWRANYPFIDGQVILTGWEEEISNVARNIMEEPSSKQLFVIRGKIRKLIEHDVSPHFIFCQLVAELKRDKDEEFQHSVDELVLDLSGCKDCKLLKEQCKGCKSREAHLKTRNMNIEGFNEEVRDHGETIQCFIKIEVFTVRFLSFYKSLVSKKAKNSDKGSAQ